MVRISKEGQPPEIKEVTDTYRDQLQLWEEDK